MESYEILVATPEQWGNEGWGQFTPKDVLPGEEEDLNLLPVTAEVERAYVKDHPRPSRDLNVFALRLLGENL